MNNLKDGEVELSDLKYSTSRAAQELLLRPNDVLFNRTNSIEHVGRTGIWRGQLAIASFASYLVRLDPDPGLLDPHYLNRWLNWLPTQQRVRRFATPGVQQVNINPTNLRRTTISLPTLHEQRQITATLDALDDAIRKTEQIVAKLKQVKQGLLYDLLTRGIDDRGELRDPERHPEQFKDSTLGRIPKNWQVQSLEHVVTAPICYGIVQAGPYVADGPYVLTIGDLHGDFRRNIHRTSPTIERGYARSRTAPLDLLMSIKGTIGRLAVVPEWYDGNISRDLARLRFAPHLNPYFARNYFESPLGQRRLELSVVGTTRAEISIHKLKPLTLPVPSNDEQDRIVSTVAVQDSTARAEANHLAKLRLLKQGLMEDLLTGRVRVTPLLEGTSP